MLPLRLQTTMYRKKSCSLLSLNFWDNIVQVDSLCNVVLKTPDNNSQENICCLSALGTTLHRYTLCNVVQEAPDNIPQEKLLFNIVLILFGQHCTGKKPV